MSLHQFKESECILTAHKHCPCIEFNLGDGERNGFQSSQLLHYRLETNEGNAGGPAEGAPEKLTLAFATADVTLTGRRLDWIADHLRDGELLAVRALPTRYANLDKARCSVASITITPITKE